jgi:hypothetical protein
MGCAGSSSSLPLAPLKDRSRRAAARSHIVAG